MKNDILRNMDMKEIDLVASVYFLVHLTMEIDTKDEIDSDLLSAVKSFVAVRIGSKKYDQCKKILREKLPDLLGEMILAEVMEKIPDNMVH